jgi:RNA polymerase sigma factor (sigma-70 family)
LKATRTKPNFDVEIIDTIKKIASRYTTIDDAVSIAFIGLFERFKNYDESRSSFKTWVTLTTHYVLWDEIKKRKNRQQKMSFISIDSLNFDFLKGDMDLERALLRKERHNALRATIAHLKYRDRLFVYFVFFMENTQRDLAKILKRTEACMSVCKNNILMQLRDLFLIQKNK